ncbi:hypothetical protein [Nonomuraea insulae]|uniref:Uncharacterized protein n=1 Tax=Nonomuraea insulae TaxID=1616787 RepID=A0ABW1D3L8_9ACTN
MSVLSDLDRIRANGVAMVSAAGSASTGAFYARTAKVVAERTGCPYVEFRATTSPSSPIPSPSRRRSATPFGKSSMVMGQAGRGAGRTMTAQPWRPARSSR